MQSYKKISNLTIVKLYKKIHLTLAHLKTNAYLCKSKTINNSKFICSYIVAEKNIDTKELKKHLSMYLANYMIPTHIIQLDTLPLNINGKIDKKLLPISVNVTGCGSKTVN